MASSGGQGAGQPESDATQYNVDIDKFLQPLESEIDIRKTPAAATEIESFTISLSGVSVPENAKYCYMKQYKEKEKEGCYPMTHKQRGRALVVTMTRDREGWKGDVKALYKIFLYLGVRVDCQFDLPGKVLLTELEKFASNEENKNVDCLFVVLMGHGGQMKDRGDNKNKEYLLTADYLAFFVREGIASIFSNVRHPDLVDKPKVFIVQMCRGGSTSEQVTLQQKTASDGACIKPPDETMLTGPSSVDDKSKQKTSGTVSHPAETKQHNQPSRKTPGFTDYLFGFATQPGLKSFRQKDEGSWYIQEMSRVFLEKAADRQVTNMLEEVNSLLELVSVDRPGLQVAEFTSALKKALYLFPGLQKTDKSPKRIEPPCKLRDLPFDEPFRVLAFRKGEALITYGFGPFCLQRVSMDGSQGTEVCFDNEINALVLQDNELMVFESTGVISKCYMENLGGPRTNIWRLEGLSLWDAVVVDNNVIVIDKSRGQVIVYDIESGCSETKVTGLDSPASIACQHDDDSTIYAIAEEGRDRIVLYNSSWTKIDEVGNKSMEKLKSPACAVFLPPQGTQDVGNLLIADRDNHHISEFTRNGYFVRHWLTESDGLKHPIAMSYAFLYMWVVHSPRQKTVSRYQIFDE